MNPGEGPQVVTAPMTLDLPSINPSIFNDSWTQDKSSPYQAKGVESAKTDIPTSQPDSAISPNSYLDRLLQTVRTPLTPVLQPIAPISPFSGIPKKTTPEFTSFPSIPKTPDFVERIVSPPKISPAFQMVPGNSKHPLFFPNSFKDAVDRRIPLPYIPSETKKELPPPAASFQFQKVSQLPLHLAVKDGAPAYQDTFSVPGKF